MCIYVEIKKPAVNIYHGFSDDEAMKGAYENLTITLVQIVTRRDLVMTYAVNPDYSPDTGRGQNWFKVWFYKLWQ